MEPKIIAQGPDFQLEETERGFTLYSIDVTPYEGRWPILTFNTKEAALKYYYSEFQTEP